MSEETQEWAAHSLSLIYTLLKKMSGRQKTTLQLHKCHFLHQKIMIIPNLLIVLCLWHTVVDVDDVVVVVVCVCYTCFALAFTHTQKMQRCFSASRDAQELESFGVVKGDPMERVRRAQKKQAVPVSEFKTEHLRLQPQQQGPQSTNTRTHLLHL